LWLYKLQYEPRDIAPLLVYIFIPAFFGDVIRFMWPAFNRLWTRVMGPLMRDKEKQQWNGVIFYLLGAWTVLSFFPKVYSLVKRGVGLISGYRNSVDLVVVMVGYRCFDFWSSVREVWALAPTWKVSHWISCGDAHGSTCCVHLLGNTLPTLRIPCPCLALLLVKTLDL
jgi:hypothetical protein